MREKWETREKKRKKWEKKKEKVIVTLTRTKTETAIIITHVLFTPHLAPPMAMQNTSNQTYKTKRKNSACE